MTPRTRVLHVITDAEPNAYFGLIAAHADRDRFDVRFASLVSSGPLQDQLRESGLPSEALGADQRRQYPRALLQLASVIRRSKIDVVQGHLLDGCLVGLLAARLARTPATVMTAHHCHEIPLLDRRALTAVDRLSAIHLSDGVISPSGQMTKTLLEHHGVSAAKVETIHHGFDFDRFDPSRADGDRVRAELGLGGGDLVISSVGRFFWVKNQEALLRAFAAIASDVPTARLLLVGAGDTSSLRQRAEELNVEHRVTFLARRNDMPDLLAATDVFLHPSLSESFGQVIIEAMAMARPVVSTPVGIAPEVLGDGNGVLAVDARAESLEAALRRALDLRREWPEMGRRARARALGFTAPKMVHRYEDFYKRLLALERRPST
jgi:glycosyltransferase involved in cell wall biosynthesis